jgi:hypothetical protein
MKTTKHTIYDNEVCLLDGVLLINQTSLKHKLNHQMNNKTFVKKSKTIHKH